MDAAYINLDHPSEDIKRCQFPSGLIPMLSSICLEDLQTIYAKETFLSCHCQGLHSKL